MNIEFLKIISQNLLLIGSTDIIQTFTKDNYKQANKRRNKVNTPTRENYDQTEKTKGKINVNIAKSVILNRIDVQAIDPVLKQYPEIIDIQDKDGMKYSELEIL